MTQEALLTEAQELPNLPFEEVSKLSAVNVSYLEELIRRSWPFIQAHQIESVNIVPFSRRIGANPNLISEITYIGFLIAHNTNKNNGEPPSLSQFRQQLEDRYSYFQIPPFWNYCIAALEAKKPLEEYAPASPEQNLFPETEPSSHHSIEEQMRDVLKKIAGNPGLSFQEIQQLIDYKLSGRVIGNLHQQGKIEIRHKNKHEKTRYFPNSHS